MKHHRLNLTRLASLLIILSIFVYLLIIAKSVIVPFAFAVLFAFMLKPLCAWIERWVSWRVGAIVLTFIFIFIPIMGLLLIFSWQFVDIYQEMNSISQKLQDGFNMAFDWLNQRFQFTRSSGKQLIKDNISTILNSPINFIGKSVSSSASFLVSGGLVIIYTFLLLLYRTAFKKFFLLQFRGKLLKNAQHLLSEIQKVTQQYLYGTLLVISILGVLNTLGLWLIGIEYPIFWGFFAAILAIIPYVGTFVGGLLLLVYAFATTTTIWQPLAVLGLFALIQFMEGNLITPNVLGESVKLNPLAAILSLVIGGMMWGIAGLILAVPMVASLKKIMQQIDVLKPVSLLLSSEIHDKKELFEEQYNEDRYRLWSFFKQKGA